MKSNIPSTLIVALLLLSACVPAETPSPAATAETTPVETKAVVKAKLEADECLACHTDKQRLIETARPVTEVEGESRGVG